MASGPVGVPRPNRRASSSNSGVWLGRRLKSPPRIRGESPAQATAVSAAWRTSAAARRGLVLACRFATQRPEGEPGEGHRASLGKAAKDEVSPVEQAVFTRPSEQGEVRAALPGAEEVGVPAGEDAANGAKPVARGERAVRACLAGGGQRGGPARRAFLQQGDVPARGAERPGRTRETALG